MKFGPGVLRMLSFSAVQFCDKTSDSIWPQDQESKGRILPGGEKKKDKIRQNI